MRRRLVLMTLLVALTLVAQSSSLRLSPVQEATFPSWYRLAQWEVANFPSKWWHRVWQTLSRTTKSEPELRAQVEQFFRLGDRERELLDQRQRLAAAEQNAGAPQFQQVEDELGQLHRQREALRPDVEEFLEGAISGVLRQQGILLDIAGLRLHFPPVDFRLDASPRLLVTSPRDRIERLDSLLLQPDITVAEMERLEERLFAMQDLSALVVGTGGVATYPSVIPADHSLRATLQVAAHEWLHQYFFFRPLGRRYWQSQETLTLNETAAEMAGRELGDLVYVSLGGTLPTITPPPQEEGESREDGEAGFRFEREMRDTRLEVNRLLGEGNVEEAEAYMEERRQVFVENGVYIRKLNQAYFAFHGSYGTSPASTSPAGGQMEELRATFPSVGPFVMAVAGVSTIEEFQALLRERGVGDIPAGDQ